MRRPGKAKEQSVTWVGMPSETRRKGFWSQASGGLVFCLLIPNTYGSNKLRSTCCNSSVMAEKVFTNKLPHYLSWVQLQPCHWVGKFQNVSFIKITLSYNLSQTVLQLLGIILKNKYYLLQTAKPLLQP